MTKLILKETKSQFVQWFNQQDDDLKFKFMTTPMEAKTELGRFRRLFIKSMNNFNWKRIKTSFKESKEG